MANRPRSTIGPPPDATNLHDAALTYLARYAATEAGLRRVLDRRVDRWARTAAVIADRDATASQVIEAKRIVREVVTRLAAAGVVDDAAFAENRARNLTRAGRSRRAVAARLAAKGVDVETARAVLNQQPDSELAAALVLARRRRIGPFRIGDPPDPQGKHRELAMLARAGFAQSVARQALAMEPDEAEAIVIQMRR